MKLPVINNPTITAHRARAPVKDLVGHFHITCDLAVLH